MILKVLGVEVGIKNRSKNEGILGRYLGIDFSWSLVDFGGQVGAKLGSKIDKKSIQKGIEKQMPKRRRLGGVLGRLECVWERLKRQRSERGRKKRERGARYAAPVGPGETQYL